MRRLRPSRAARPESLREIGPAAAARSSSVHGALLASLIAACGGVDPLHDTLDGGPGDDGTQGDDSSYTSSETGGGDALDDGPGDGGACPPGEAREGCPCIQGACPDTSLACVAGRCEMPQSPADGGDGSATASGGDDTTGGDPGACVGHDECGATEVCDPDLGCTPVGHCEFDVVVHSFTPADCSGGPLDGDADLFYVLESGGVVHSTSGWIQGGCPGAWPDELALLPVGFADADSFYLTFLDADVSGSEFMDALCFGVTDCGGPLPPSYLKAGKYLGPTGLGGLVDVEFLFAGCR